MDGSPETITNVCKIGKKPLLPEELSGRAVARELG